MFSFTQACFITAYLKVNVASCTLTIIYGQPKTLPHDNFAMAITFE